MPPTTTSDVLIIGGGLSGLSLALALIDNASELTVAVVEPRTRYQDDRTWSFWGPVHHRMDSLVSHRWPRWCFGLADSDPQTIDYPSMPYQSIASIDFYRHAADRIGASDTVTLYLGEAIEHCEQRRDTEGSSWRAHSPDHEFNARVVIDTRPPPTEQFQTSALYQCFVGDVIDITDAFDPACLELMTDMASDAHGLSFTYCLPFSPNQALVEITRFSPQPVDWAVLEDDLQALKARRGWLDAPIQRTERGQLPMGMAPRQATDSGYVYAGTSAGGLRAATGYGFWRIQRWAQHCAASLDADMTPLAHPPEPKIQGWMDGLFLQVLRHHPKRAPEFFFRLYQRVRADVLVRFLSDQSSAIDKLKVVLSLPKRPFLGILVKR